MDIGEPRITETDRPQEQPSPVNRDGGLRFDKSSANSVVVLEVWQRFLRILRTRSILCNSALRFRYRGLFIWIASLLCSAMTSVLPLLLGSELCVFPFARSQPWCFLIAHDALPLAS